MRVRVVCHLEDTYAARQFSMRLTSIPGNIKIKQIEIHTSATVTEESYSE